MNVSPEEPSQSADVDAVEAEDWRDDPLLKGQEDVDPDDEDVDHEPTGVSEADVDPDDDSVEDYPDVPSE